MVRMGHPLIPLVGATDGSRSTPSNYAILIWPHCPRAQAYCKEHEPGLEPQEENNHRAACFFPVLEGQQIEEPATGTPYRSGE